MLRLTMSQRAVLLDKIPDVANVAVGASVFGQLLAERPFSLPVAVSGIAVWATLMGLTLLIGRERQQ